MYQANNLVRELTKRKAGFNTDILYLNISKITIKYKYYLHISKDFWFLLVNHFNRICI